MSKLPIKIEKASEVVTTVALGYYYTDATLPLTLEQIEEIEKYD